ncbi:DUF3445 domain-containing protein [uncultured Pelagimonas sp.]|uniref:heme-dependent oxidative N-demethylase family protein n=1 Tax=uncultured Pelagimonas sp. TaxID=1618102 RepID=UPI00261D304E|nr:DUF3445 domain-containing protein [uncultured Pelagimonas sp.]
MTSETGFKQPLIVNRRLPFDLSKPRPLPGIAPLEMAEWLHVDETYEQQMALRRRLITERPQDVLAQSQSAGEAAEELLEIVLQNLPPLSGKNPDHAAGAALRFTSESQGSDLEKIGKIVQEDFCILQKTDSEHVMTAAVLCFPASWMLLEKINRPLTHIHGAVDEYDPNIAKRVQRLFDGVRPEKPLWRWNALWNDDPDLFQPRAVSDPRPPADPDTAPYLRCERQCILRLPETKAVVFSIHSFVLNRDDAMRAYCKT